MRQGRAIQGRGRATLETKPSDPRFIFSLCSHPVDQRPSKFTERTGMNLGENMEEAISRMEKFDRKMQAARDLEADMEEALDQDDDCLLRRVIGADGRSRAFINGNAVTMQQLKAIGERLLDIHGQHFH